MPAPTVVDAADERRRWLSVLAKARPAEVSAAWDQQDLRPSYRLLRPPEIGMVMVRGRMGGAGDAFNLGEMTVTRAAVRLDDGPTGIGYVAGRDRRHAEIAAILDAMMQSPTLRPAAESVVEPLAAAQLQRRQVAGRKAAATKVDFFTMVRTRGPQA
ncbi:phosphonate C-P lyase system protein PhnG [Phenylobacterium sp.]|jgi:alpha-D-ribose 1-methylphosphonate 5-triphosphate synthase subunit PhnG|uniref:phosphonate C-P lyase system protein PhnG n=1 Tax=Phenylobacterium sp. TaxID=1871053 RepID=UPI0037C723A1